MKHDANALDSIIDHRLSQMDRQLAAKDSHYCRYELAVVAKDYAEHVYRWRATSTPPLTLQTITICHNVDKWSEVVIFDPESEPHDLFMANATHWMPFEWPEVCDEAR